MDSGNYFELRESSNLLKDQILFSYTCLKSKKGCKFPIALVFNNERIDFYFNGLIERSVENTLKESIHPEFIETLLFSLDLHEGKENISRLNDFLSDLFDRDFPVFNQFNIHALSQTRCTNENHLTYSQLNQFLSRGSVGKQLQYRVLFLDFLFDVYHSDVFKNCPKFSLIKHRLDEIPFIVAIKRKAEFYYQMENHARYRSKDQLVTFNCSNLYFIENLIGTQKSWLNLLRENDINFIINRENKWFENVENEVKQVLSFSLEEKDFINYKDIEQIDCRNRSWNWNIYSKHDTNQKYACIKWFIKRNNLLDAFGSIKEVRRLSKIFASALLLLIFDIVYLIEDKIYFRSNPDLTKYNSYLLVGLILIFLGFIINNALKKDKLTKQYFGIIMELSLIPFLVLILSSAFIIFEVTSFANKFIIFNTLVFKWIAGVFLLFIIIFITIILLQRIIVKREHLTNKVLKYLLVIIVIFCVTYVAIDISLLSRISKIGEELLFLIAFLFGVFIFLYYHEQKSHPKLDVKTSFKKVFSMLLIGLVFSFFANLLIINFEYKDFLEKFNFIDEVWKGASNPKHNPFPEIIYKTDGIADFKFIKILHEKGSSSSVDASIEEYYYLPLQQLKLIKNEKELYPIIKELEINGVKIITIPAVLYFNTLLTLVFAIFIQIVLNHKTFLEGGKT